MTKICLTNLIFQVYTLKRNLKKGGGLNDNQIFLEIYLLIRKRVVSACRLILRISTPFHSASDGRSAVFVYREVKK